VTQIPVYNLTKVALAYKGFVARGAQGQIAVPVQLGGVLAKAVVTIDRAWEEKRNQVVELMKAGHEDEANELATTLVELELPVLDAKNLANDVLVDLEALMVLTYYELVDS